MPPGVRWRLKLEAGQGEIEIEILALTNLHSDNRHNMKECLSLTTISVPGSLQDQPPMASSWPDIIYEMRIEILTLTNLHLDMYEVLPL